MARPRERKYGSPLSGVRCHKAALLLTIYPPTHPNPLRMARPKGEERTQHLRTFSPSKTFQDAQAGSTTAF